MAQVPRFRKPFRLVAKILDDDGNDLPPIQRVVFFEDTTGRGVIYYNDPEKSADAHIAPGGFTLGEIAYMNEDGYVFITDRFSDMVVSGGNIIPPRPNRKDEHRGSRCSLHRRSKQGNGRGVKSSGDWKEDDRNQF